MPYKVMIVDDEKWNRDMVRTLVEWDRHGLELAGEAEDGDGALNAIRETGSQIVITDMRMPGMDGVRLMERIHETYPDIKTIVVSGYDDFHYLKHAIRYRAVDYLLKPIDPKELNAILSKCVSDLASASVQERELPLEMSLALSTCKQLLQRHFNELNRGGISHALEQVRKELNVRGITQPSRLERVVLELQVALKETMNANMLSEEPLPPIGRNDTVTSETAIRFVEEQYLRVLDMLAASRKFKNKLNLEEIKQYAERHFAENITLEQMAKVFYVSKEYLSKAFKQEYGLNLTDYILRQRMEKAKEWLLDEGLSIKAVAEMAGYEDVAYFYRVFKKHYGVAPGEMRKKSLVEKTD
ncbi:response regulator [Paenibacillus thailandensis]|uniref:Response regulator n=1 Tax=Paenibacillus thailandensis TaxID=393250 RepID=A0ABW5QUC9_9BACL